MKKPALARLLYTSIWWILLPILPLRLWWRGRREPGYRQYGRERFGFYNIQRPDGMLIWLHAVSLGETRAAAPLVKALRQRYPNDTLLITHMTATGRATATECYGADALIATLPYDYPFAMRRFLQHFKPRFGLILETEIWPNLNHTAAQMGIPLYLVNARLSARSARGYARFAVLIQTALQQYKTIAAQSEEDAARLRTLGAQHVITTGNIKFDIDIPTAQHARATQLRHWLGDAPLILAASTRAGEESLILEAFQRATLPEGTKLILVPRHPQRFNDVEQQIKNYGYTPYLLSNANLEHQIDARANVILGDSMGMLYAWYGAATLALMGGSWLPYGMHNLIEAAEMHCPTLLGPHTFNFATATQDAVAAGAALQAQDTHEAFRLAGTLLTHPAQLNTMKLAAQHFSQAHRGATARIMDQLPLAQ